MELLRNGLKLVAVQGLDDSEGSVNVPVKLVHNSDDQYINFTEQVHIRYINSKKAFEEILPSKDSGFYIPGKVFVESGPIQLAVHLINGDVERVTNELQFVVKKAPNGKTLVDPSEFSWQQLVDQYVNAKLDTFVNKSDLSIFEEKVNGSVEKQNKKITDLQSTTKASLDSQSKTINDFKTEVNTNLNHATSAQNSKITTLESRMDTFTSLKEGSTTGDAELQDVRVGSDGTKYASAGDAVREQVGKLNDDLDKFNPLLSYVYVGAKVLSGVKNRFDIENIADTGFHISINVKAGEKYLINGSGFNDNHPLYVICSDSAVIGYSDDVSYSYKANVNIDIPYGATKLYVNGKQEYHPFVKKLVYANYKKVNEETTYDVPLNIQHLIYHSEIENLTNDSGYSALIPVVKDDKYILTGSGYGQFSSYICYDKNMVITSYGESEYIENKLVIIESDGYLRVQNNNKNLLKAIKYAEKKAIFIGDSYVQGNSLGDNQNKRFSTILSELLKIKEINVGAGGCGYFKTDEYPTSFYQQLINAIDSMSNEEWANVKYIIICGGRNDPNNNPNATQAEYDEAISDICDMVSIYFPCAKLVFVPYLFDSNYMPNNYYIHYLKLINALRKNKCTVINYAYTWLTGRFADILEDNVHPNVNGHNIIAHNLYNALMGGNIINSQSVRLMGTGAYMPNWTYIDCMLLGTDTLNIFGNFTISENVQAQTIILEHTFEENNVYTAYTGRTSFSLLISNLSTGISYSVFIKYENGKIRLYTNTEIPKGNYFISYNIPFGRL